MPPPCSHSFASLCCPSSHFFFFFVFQPCRLLWETCWARCPPTPFPPSTRCGVTVAPRSSTPRGFFSWWPAASEERGRGVSAGTRVCCWWWCWRLLVQLLFFCNCYRGPGRATRSCSVPIFCWSSMSARGTAGGVCVGGGGVLVSRLRLPCPPPTTSLVSAHNKRPPKLFPVTTPPWIVFTSSLDPFLCVQVDPNACDFSCVSSFVPLRSTWLLYW